MRLHHLALAAAVGAACEGTAPARPATRTIASARRGRPGSTRGGRHGAVASPPAVDSAARCSPETFRTLARYRAGRTVHFGPLCTDVYRGRFSAVMATGTAEEATDVWVLFHDPRGDEIHRVRRWPVGARVAFGRVAQGWVYLLGRTVALEDMPADTTVLAIFPLPRPGGAAPEVGLLSPLEAGLLRAADVDDLDRRLTFEMPPADPTPAEAERAVRAIADGGPNALLDRLTPEGAPTLRAWQVGAFQESDYVSPQGDPTSPHLARAVALIRQFAQSMDCSAGDRCIGRPTQALGRGVTPDQVMLLKEGQRVVVAALLSGAEARPEEAGRVTPWGPERADDASDRALAERLAMDGAVVGPVVGAARGEERVVAFEVAVASGGREVRAYVVTPGHAPRAFTDPSLGEVAGDRTLHLRDYERDGGFELVTAGQQRDGTAVASIASQAAPRSVAQHALTQRLDMLRVAFNLTDARAIDGALRGYRPAPAEPEAACALLDRVAGLEPRAFLAATGGTLAVIPYRETGQPLRGEPRRLQRRDLGDPGTVLGAFAGLRCGELRCDWPQSLCHLADNSREGVLWFSNGGRRIAAVSLRTP